MWGALFRLLMDEQHESRKRLFSIEENVFALWIDDGQF